MPTLVFPNLEAFQLAITAGIVPEAVRLAPARGHIDAAGPVTVQTSAKLPGATLKALQSLGAASVKAPAAPLEIEGSCWLQLLPLRRTAQSLEYGDKTAVLFELTDEAQLPNLVGEMLRLGNDRQSFRYLDQGNQRRALLRVMGPPYYSLLRALEDHDHHAAPRAYVRQGERVWVQVGYSHPLAERIQPAANQMLLLGPPHRWTYVEEAKFRDIYEVLEFRLPQATVYLHETPLADRIRVPLSLSTGGSSDAGELWVVEEDAIAQLDALVSEADDRLIGRLAFAAAERDGQPTVVLRARPSKEPPPVLVLRGVAYRPYLKLPNLFLPVGRRLHPPLRRDAVSKLLASDRSLITWLAPRGGAEFVPQSLPDDAFRPLSDWVEYVLDHEHEALAAWTASTQFDFEPFVCRDDGPGRRDLHLEKRKPPRRRSAPREATEPDEPRKRQAADEQYTADGTEDGASESRLAETSRPIPPDQLELRVRELEQQFTALDLPPDAPERRPLWRELARAYAALEYRRDATICWSHALWEDERPTAQDLHAWLSDEERHTPGPTFGAGAVEDILERADARPPEPGALAAYVTWSAAREQPPAEIIPHLSALAVQLERQEANLPVRAGWLAWRALAQLANGDVLALAKARDRSLERLFQQGLRPEFDLPGFLRVAGQPDTERFRVVQERIDDLRRSAHRWLSKTPPSERETAAYVDLIFAYANARLGENAKSAALVQSCAGVLGEGGAIHAWLLDAFSLRIQTLMEGRPPAATLPEPLMSRLQQLKEAESYAIDRLRKESSILEPFERHNPFLRYAAKHGDELDQRLLRVIDETDREQLQAATGELLAEHDPRTTDSQRSLEVLEVLLQIAPRLGEAFALELLAAVTEVLRRKIDLQKRAVLLERSLLLAGHFDRTDYVQAFAGGFLELLRSESRENIANDAFEALLKHCFHSLRRLGLQESLDALLRQLTITLRADRTSDGVRGSAWYPAQAGKIANELKKGTELMHVGKILLQLAAVRFHYGDQQQALEIITDIRKAVLFGQFEEGPRMRLARAYVAALGEAPIELAYERIQELFTNLPHGENKFIGTMKYYHVWELTLIEAAVLALVGDGLHLNAQGRRWLDEDEFLVRRRVHRDMREAMAQEAT